MSWEETRFLEIPARPVKPTEHDARTRIIIGSERRLEDQARIRKVLGPGPAEERRKILRARQLQERWEKFDRAVGLARDVVAGVGAVGMLAFIYYIYKP